MWEPLGSATRSKQEAGALSLTALRKWILLITYVILEVDPLPDKSLDENPALATPWLSWHLVEDPGKMCPEYGPTETEKINMCIVFID